MFIFLLSLISSQHVVAEKAECEKLESDIRYGGGVEAWNALTSFLNNTKNQFSSDLNSNYTRTTMTDYNGTELVTTQILNKTYYNFGSYIPVYPALVNIGNKSVSVTHYFYPFFIIVNYQNGTTAFRDGPSIEPMNVPEFATFMTNDLKPNKPMTNLEARFGPPVDPYQTFWVSHAGKYTVSTVSDLFLDVNGTCNRIFLWSNPIPITVLSENEVQNGTDLSQPLKQFKSGTLLNEIMCKNGFTLLSKTSDNSPACVKPDTAQKLAERGWGTIIKHFI